MTLGHSQIAFDLDKHGPVALESALRRLPTGGTLRLLGSGLGLKRVGGGRTFRLHVPPKITEPTGIKQDDLKSVTTAVPALVEAHTRYVESTSNSSAM